MNNKENLRSILIIFISGIIFFLIWDIVESYFLNPPKVDKVDYKKVDLKYTPDDIEEFMLENENN